MAAEQARRENVTDERKIDAEKDRVPKVKTHFESLAEKIREEKDATHPVDGERVNQFETVPVSTAAESGLARKAREGEEEEKQRHGVEAGGGDQREEMQGKEGREAPSLEEISKLRGMAQLNFMEAIRAAEERYEKAKKEMDSLAAAKPKEMDDAAAEKAKESTGQAEDTTVERIHRLEL